MRSQRRGERLSWLTCPDYVVTLRPGIKPTTAIFQRRNRFTTKTTSNTWTDWPESRCVIAFRISCAAPHDLTRYHGSTGSCHRSAIGAIHSSTSLAVAASLGTPPCNWWPSFDRFRSLHPLSGAAYLWKSSLRIQCFSYTLVPEVFPWHDSVVAL